MFQKQLSKKNLVFQGSQNILPLLIVSKVSKPTVISPGEK